MVFLSSSVFGTLRPQSQRRRSVSHPCASGAALPSAIFLLYSACCVAGLSCPSGLRDCNATLAGCPPIIHASLAHHYPDTEAQSFSFFFFLGSSSARQGQWVKTFSTGRPPLLVRFAREEDSNYLRFLSTPPYTSLHLPTPSYSVPLLNRLSLALVTAFSANVQGPVTVRTREACFSSTFTFPQTTLSSRPRCACALIWVFTRCIGIEEAGR